LQCRLTPLGRALRRPQDWRDACLATGSLVGRNSVVWRRTALAVPLALLNCLFADAGRSMLCDQRCPKARQMAFGQALFAVVVIFLSLHAPASAVECTVNGPRYQLALDTVSWSMKISSGQKCIRGLRFSNVVIDALKLVSPPRTGQVTIQGPSFTYSAKPEYSGEDTFTISVSGSINRLMGTSNIRVSVFVDNPVPVGNFRDRNSDPVSVPQPRAATPIDNNLPLPGSLPCPRWDWSNGAPPPMRPPFDTSKLYCPPTPFEPPNQPLGCRCKPL
jgi:hypothetical protein